MKITRTLPVFVISTFLLLVSCGGLHIAAPTAQEYSGLSLGMIGERNGLLESGFEIKAHPPTNEKWAVRLIEKSFDKTSFKRLQKVSGPKGSDIKFSDSSVAKPTYFVAELIDDVKYATAMNSAEHRDLFAFAKANMDTRVITKVSGILNGTDIPKGGIWYLETTKDGGMELVAYAKGKAFHHIDFSEITLFDYELSFCCWGLDARNKTRIFDLVEEGKSCSNPLTKKVKKLTKEKNIYTF